MYVFPLNFEFDFGHEFYFEFKFNLLACLQSRRCRLTSVDYDQNAVVEYKKKVKSKYDKQMRLFRLVNKIEDNGLVDANFLSKNDYKYFFKNDETRYY
jgi:hypothetical protein